MRRGYLELELIIHFVREFAEFDPGEHLLNELRRISRNDLSKPPVWAILTAKI